MTRVYVWRRNSVSFELAIEHRPHAATALGKPLITIEKSAGATAKEFACSNSRSGGAGCQHTILCARILSLSDTKLCLLLLQTAITHSGMFATEEAVEALFKQLDSNP